MYDAGETGAQRVGERGRVGAHPQQQLRHAGLDRCLGRLAEQRADDVLVGRAGIDQRVDLPRVLSAHRPCGGDAVDLPSADVDPYVPPTAEPALDRRGQGVRRGRGLPEAIAGDRLILVHLAIEGDERDEIGGARSVRARHACASFPAGSWAA